MMPTTTDVLPAQLQALESELTAARDRAHRLTRGLSEEAWRQRPAPDRWSIGEQIVHLNLTSRAFLPLLDEAVRSARDQGKVGEGSYRRDFLGWLLGRLMEPPVRMRVKTTAPFVPSAIQPMEEALRDFDRLHDELAALLSRAAGLALDRVEIVSPFDGRVRYNVWSALRILTAHQRRHLWLAERARTEER